MSNLINIVRSKKYPFNAVIINDYLRKYNLIKNTKNI